MAAPTGGPVIMRQPAGCHVAHLGQVELTVIAVGDGVLSYQWWAGAAPVEGATHPILAISSARKAQHQGLYCVQVHPHHCTNLQCAIDFLFRFSPPMTCVLYAVISRDQ